MNKNKFLMIVIVTLFMLVVLLTLQGGAPAEAATQTAKATSGAMVGGC